MAPAVLVVGPPFPHPPAALGGRFGSPSSHLVGRISCSPSSRTTRLGRLGASWSPSPSVCEDIVAAPSVTVSSVVVPEVPVCLDSRVPEVPLGPDPCPVVPVDTVGPEG